MNLYIILSENSLATEFEIFAYHDTVSIYNRPKVIFRKIIIPIFTLSVMTAQAQCYTKHESNSLQSTTKLDLQRTSCNCELLVKYTRRKTHSSSRLLFTNLYTKKS